MKIRSYYKFEHVTLNCFCFFPFDTWWEKLFCVLRKTRPTEPKMCECAKKEFERKRINGHTAEIDQVCWRCRKTKSDWQSPRHKMFSATFKLCCLVGRRKTERSKKKNKTHSIFLTTYSFPAAGYAWRTKFRFSMHNMLWFASAPHRVPLPEKRRNNFRNVSFDFAYVANTTQLHSTHGLL